MTNKEQMYIKIKDHGEKLKVIFRLPEDHDPIKLCKWLRQLEKAASSSAEALCNGEIDQEVWGSRVRLYLDRLDDCLGFRVKNIPVIINGDPRGYALKISDNYMKGNPHNLFRDMGGYGILAPDFRP
jgi:hypothetical protein